MLACYCAIGGGFSELGDTDLHHDRLSRIERRIDLVLKRVDGIERVVAQGEQHLHQPMAL